MSFLPLRNSLRMSLCIAFRDKNDGMATSKFQRIEYNTFNNKEEEEEEEDEGSMKDLCCLNAGPFVT